MPFISFDAADISDEADLRLFVRISIFGGMINVHIIK
jgi:hypothetical protein